MFETEIPRLSVFDKAAAGGIGVCDVKDKMAARAWDAYEAAAKEILHGR